jgi:hypothetical protein
MIPLKDYLHNVSVRRNAAYISGDVKSWLANGKFYTNEEFDKAFPINVPIMPKKFKGINPDLKRNFVNNHKSY